MAKAKVVLPASAKSRYPKVAIVTESGGVVTLPYAPNEVEHSKLAALFVQQTRPGREPLLQRAGGQLREMKVVLDVVRPDGSSIEDVLAQLVWICALGDRVRIGYTFLTGGLWRITDHSITELDHAEVTNQCVHATAELTFTWAPAITVKAGSEIGSKAVRTVARGGDSSAELKQRTRSALTAGQLADLNGIRDYRKITAGRTIRPGS